MKDPMFTIITPVYNREKTIRLAVESVMKQTCGDWEMLLIDDGSTDHTGDVCKEYASHDARMHYIYKENGGVSTARNVGLKCAAGRYILFLDSDDFFQPNTLEVLHAKIDADPQLDLICFGFGKWTPVQDGKDRLVGQEEVRSILLPTFLNIYPQNGNFVEVYVWNKCYKANFLRENGIMFNENKRTWEDGSFIIDCLACAQNALMIPDILHAFGRCEEERLSSAVFENQVQNYILDQKNYKARFEAEFDFQSKNYCRSRFNAICLLFDRMSNAFPKRAVEIIKLAIHEPIVVSWAACVVPQNSAEKRLQTYITCGRADKIFSFYHNTVLKRIVRKIRRTLKRLTGI